MGHFLTLYTRLSLLDAFIWTKLSDSFDHYLGYCVDLWLECQLRLLLVSQLFDSFLYFSLILFRYPRIPLVYHHPAIDFLNVRIVILFFPRKLCLDLIMFAQSILRLTIQPIEYTRSRRIYPVSTATPNNGRVRIAVPIVGYALICH